MDSAADPRPLVVHVVNRFDTGGLENGIVNLINRMPQQAYRHAVWALTDISEFRSRVRIPGVQFVALNKSAGHGFKLYPRLWRLLRQHRPAVLHTRNLGPLEMQVAAAAARVPVRIQGEHGRELNDLDGRNRKLQLLRRVYSPFVQRWVTVSRDLERYLVDRVGLPTSAVTCIYNGVDTERFAARVGTMNAPAGFPFDPTRHWVVGTVGRMQGVKGSVLLAEAFVRALSLRRDLRSKWRLVMVGDGPLRAEVQAVLRAAHAEELAWIPGERNDVADVMRAMSCFVLPSLAEGISNTILEAMATGLPVLATDVGGNTELVQAGRTGEIVPSGDSDAIAQALVRLYEHPALLQDMGRAARQRVEQSFSLHSMVAAYQSLYERELCTAGYVGKGSR